MGLNPFRTIRAKGEKWEDNIAVYDHGNGPCTDTILFLISTWGMDEKEAGKMIKFLETLEYENSYKYQWTYQDQAHVDYDDNCAYVDPVYGELDVIYTEEGYVGRRVIENEEVVWEDIEDYFVDDHSRALPSWYPYDQLFGAGYEDVSCEFENGLYGRVDMPEDIARKLYDKGAAHVVFQIKSAGPFAVNFCVWAEFD